MATEDNVLSVEEIKQFEEILKKFGEIGEELRNLAMDYLVIFKKRSAMGVTIFFIQGSSHTEFSNLCKSAVYCASRSANENKYDCISINGILSNFNEMTPFFSHLKEFISTISLDKNTDKEILKICEDFSFTLTFYNKFEQVFSKLQFSYPQNDSISENLNYLKKSLWILFILAKKSLFNNRTDIVESMCLLNSVFVTAIVETFTWNQSYYLYGSPDTKEMEVCPEKVKSKMLEIFFIKDNELYSNISKQFKNFFELNFSNYEYFKESNIKELLTMADTLYSEKLINMKDEIDARFFLKENSSNLLKSRFTPFYKQGKLNAILAKKKTIKFNISAMKCKKFLNYEFKENINNTNNIHEIVTLS